VKRTPGGVSEEIRKRHAWLELLQISGPFLTLPVVHRVFQNGLAEVPARERAEVRGLVAQMMDDHGASRHKVIETLLRDVFDWQHHLLIDAAVPETLTEIITEHNIPIRPDFGYFDEQAEDVDEDADEDTADEDDGDHDDQADDGDEDESDAGGRGDAAVASAGSGPWKLLGMVTAWGTHPLTRTSTGSWTANAVERLAILLRARDVPVGIVTDGRWWVLVWAPRGGATGAAVWDASVFSEEPSSLQALVALLVRTRFQAEARVDQLPALFAESLERQEEVTEQLGRQVREAVELLVTTLDQLDRESDGALLADVSDDDFYAGVVTVMMRVVFLLFAEERRLLPSDDDLYVTAYSVGHLVEQLEQQDSLGAVLRERTAAWHRLLAVTRAVYSGVAHEDLRLPAYGGSLFDPDRYPWLEGRTDASTPAAAARPPAVDDRTVLRMLRAVQYVVIGSERRRLTFRALDVEQIGYVYEGLLELEVRTANETVLGLTRPSKWPRKIKADAEVAVTMIGTLSAKDLSIRINGNGKKANDIEHTLASPVDSERVSALHRIVSDPVLVELITPFLDLLRFDELGLLAIYLPGGRYVTSSHRRAATGTHYTPRPLAEEIAEGALEPLVYRPGPLETSDSAQWHIRPSNQIKGLNVADIAMGSGAFLVAACRYLADRLIEAWVAEGDAEALAIDLHRTAGRAGADAEADQLLLKARREITEHCLYGVDINPLAVEMAKLSLWLITMDRERPFGFLDDRFKAGDSLLGLVSIEQLETLHVDAKEGRRLHHGTLDIAEGWLTRLQQAADKRRSITARPVVTIRDVEHKARLLADADGLTAPIKPAGNAVTATGLVAAKLRGRRCDAEFINLAFRVGTGDNIDVLNTYVKENLQDPRPKGSVEREPFHWPLEFPEVFADTQTPGFDAIIGNPPFLGGSKISGTYGDDYLNWLQRWDGNDVKGAADLATRFVLRANRLLSTRGQFAYVTTKTIVEGAPLRVGMEQLTNAHLSIRIARSPHPWPTKSASLQVVEFWATHARPSRSAAYWVDGEEVPAIGPDLQPYGRVHGRPSRLAENTDIAFNGSKPTGVGFVLSFEQRDELLALDRRNTDVIQPYVTGADLNRRYDTSASRCIINFQDWSLEHAEEYPDCLDVIRRLVKPERDRNKRKIRRERWWIYGERAPELYETIGSLGHVLALSRHGNTLAPARVATGVVFSEATVVFALDDFASMAMLSSNIHFIWAVRYGSTIRTDIRYVPTDVFLTLPRPELTPELEALGRQLDTIRGELMRSRAWGLTKTYNRIHDPDVHEPVIQELRDIHIAIDEAVTRAYGWDDLDLKIGHHLTKIGVRWTVSKEARFELLDRLLEENQRRYALENPS
jgi:hypothetical protein